MLFSAQVDFGSVRRDVATVIYHTMRLAVFFILQLMLLLISCEAKRRSYHRPWRSIRDEDSDESGFRTVLRTVRSGRSKSSDPQPPATQLTTEAETQPQTQTTTRTQPTTQTQTTASEQTTNQEQHTIQAHTTQTLPTTQAQTTTQTLPTTQAQTTTQTLPTTQAQTTTQTLPTTQAQTTTQTLPTTQAQTTTQTLPTTQAQTTTSIEYTFLTANSPDCDSSLAHNFPVRVQYRTTSVDTANQQSGATIFNKWVDYPYESDVVSEVDELSIRKIEANTSIQIRFIQQEHRGGFCDCWALANLSIIHSDSVREADYCDKHNTSSNFIHSALMEKMPSFRQQNIVAVFCEDSASVPREFTVQFGGDVASCDDLVNIKNTPIDCSESDQRV